jgi:hypothetical protein
VRLQKTRAREALCKLPHALIVTYYSLFVNRKAKKIKKNSKKNEKE